MFERERLVLESTFVDNNFVWQPLIADGFL